MLNNPNISKNLNFEIKKFVIKHGDKKRTIDQSLFSTDPDDILNDILQALDKS